MKINNLFELISFASEMQNYLVDHGILFDKRGLPILDSSYFLKEYPEMVIPVQHWKSKRIINRGKTCLCFFCADIHIYRRMQKLLGELHI